MQQILSKGDVEIVRVDDNISETNITCLVDYEEMPDLMEETLLIQYEVTDDVSMELADDILREFKSFYTPPSSLYEYKPLPTPWTPNMFK